MNVEELRGVFDLARSEGVEQVRAVSSLEELDQLRVRVMGRKAPLSSARAELRNVPDDARKEMGRYANEVQQSLETAFQAKRDELLEVARTRRWQEEWIDVTLPGDGTEPGSTHLLTRTMWAIVDVFVGLGYRVLEGPEVELSTLNFDALNTPYEHPSRSPSDTFFVAGTDEQVCLRTQTSPMQVRAMRESDGPLYVVVPGRTYRRDALDATHLAQFSQIEGLAVDLDISMSDLRGTLEAFAHAIFGDSLDIRLRPHFFPFTEPSAEMDVQCFVCMGRGCRVCKRSGWIEILGCGMVHPNVLEAGGYDPETYSGFAFGMGLERIAALSHAVPDIRWLYDNDLRFSSAFKGLA